MRAILLVLLALLLGRPAFGASGAQTQVRLLLSHATARPGDTVTAVLQLRMPPDTHTYWRNPGESGIATAAQWTLPKGVTAGDIQWPVPERFDFGGIICYGYHDEVVLLVPLKLAAGLPPGPLELAAKVSWLECKELCVPGKADLKATLPIASEPKPSADAGLIAAAQKQLPADGAALGATAHWAGAPSGESRPLLLEWKPAGNFASADFLPYSGDGFEITATNTVLPVEAGQAGLRLLVTKSGPNWPTRLAGVLVEKPAAASPARAFEIAADITSAPGALTSKPAGNASVGFGLLAQMMGLAFLGGLILNIMPCVFPVIALKILGFVQQNKQAPERVFRLGLFYAFGVVVSFLVLAGMVIAVRQAGGAASWGMQMQNPQFTLGLTTLVVLVALNLFGVFEVNPGGRAIGVAGALAAREGAAGAFMNGVLATVLATPCTAPFLAPALGFAFAQPAAIIVVMFVAVALGLAAPYVVLSGRPGWLKFLPRPGAWMEKFKIAMGFPMLATAIWIFSFTARRFGPDGPLWVGLFLVTTALAAWVWGDFVQRAGRRRAAAIVVSLLVFAGGYGGALEHELHWRAPAKFTRADGVVETSGGIAWQRWSPDAVAKARADGRPVLVDFTADWCLTCKYNKATALDVPAVRAKLQETKAVALVGDDTDQEPAIVTELNKFGRAGVPLVLVYPRQAAKPPIVLPALLTQGIVLEALDKAAE